MLRFVVDTNIIILHVANKIVLTFEPFTAAVSTLTVFELFKLPGMSRKEEGDIHAFLNICEQVPVTDRIAARAAYLARTHRIGAIDIIIAATALELNIPLLTKNVKDFRSISQLRISDTPN